MSTSDPDIQFSIPRDWRILGSTCFSKVSKKLVICGNNTPNYSAVSATFFRQQWGAAILWPEFKALHGTAGDPVRRTLGRGCSVPCNFRTRRDGPPVPGLALVQVGLLTALLECMMQQGDSEIKDLVKFRIPIMRESIRAMVSCYKPDDIHNTYELALQ